MLRATIESWRLARRDTTVAVSALTLLALPQSVATLSTICDSANVSVRHIEMARTPWHYEYQRCDNHHMFGDDVAANEDGRPAHVGNGRPEASPGVARRTGGTGRFAQELAAADDPALTRLRALAERAEAAQVDLRRDAAQAILSLRRQGEFWQLVADGVERTEAAAVAALAALAGIVGLADHAVAAGATGSDRFADNRDIGKLADHDINTCLAEQFGIAAFADPATSWLADSDGSADTPNVAEKSGKSGNRDVTERDA